MSTQLNRRAVLNGFAGITLQAYAPWRANLLWNCRMLQESEPKPEDIPKDLLASSFPPALLEKSLLSAAAWHPFPVADDREAWHHVPQALQAAIVARAEQVVGTNWDTLHASTFLDFSRTGNRSTYEFLYFKRRQRLTDVVLGECVEGKGRFVDEILNGAWLICDEAFWGVPAHLYLQRQGVGLPDVSEPVVDLFAAETSSTLAWIVYLLREQLDPISPLITSRIRSEVKRRILEPILLRTDFNWMGLRTNHGRLNNWNPWINSNCLATTLLLETDASRRIKLVAKICASLDQFLADYSPDGGCEEGPVYWQRSAASYFDCCWLLVSATQRATNPLAHPFIRKMGHYIADVHISGSFYVNYGDAHAEDAPSPELIYRFGVETQDNILAEFGAFGSSQHGLASSGKTLQDALSAGLPSLARALPDVLIVSKMQSASKADVLLRDSWYPALGLMTARQKASQVEGFYLAVQASGNGRSHGHNDTGSFIVFCDGEPVFIDVGVEAYSARTFSAERYKIWTMQSAYHNLPTIDGVMQHEGHQFHASDVRYSSTDKSAAMSMNLAGAYPVEAGVKRWVREITLHRDTDSIILSERFELQGPRPVTLTLMTPRLPTTSTRGSVVLGDGRTRSTTVILQYDPDVLTPKVEPIELKDEGLRRSWGARIYRLLLVTNAPAASGDWNITIHKEQTK